MTSYKQYGSNSNYFKTEDLLQKSYRLKIESVEPQEFTFDGIQETKLVVSFVGVEKTLMLNKVNATKLEQLSGSEHIEDWEGLDLILFADDTTYGRKATKGMRLRSATETSAPIVDPTTESFSEPVRATDYANGEADSEDIPF